MTEPSYELDVDTALRRLADGRYEGTVTDRWTVAGGPNGGYVAALALRGVLAESVLPDPLTMTVHYLARPVTGPIDVLVETLRVGRGHTTLSVRLVQDEVKAAGLVTLGRLRAPTDHDFAPDPPDFGAGPNEAVALLERPGMDGASLWGRLDRRVGRPGDVMFLRDEPGEAFTGGWTRLADGRPADALCVPLFLDCWPPAVFSRTMVPSPTGAPTIELTVHWRQRLGPGWHNARFTTRLVAGGYMDEEGELWSEDGRLVADSRQLARY